MIVVSAQTSKARLLEIQDILFNQHPVFQSAIDIIDFFLTSV